MNNWLFSTGVNFTFPGKSPVLAFGDRIIVLPEGLDATAFRIANQVPESVVIHGGLDGFTGSLRNEGENIVLAKQGPPNADEDGFVPIIPVDYVHYDVVSPWPHVGANGGRSIERISLSSLGSDFDNWKASNALGGSPGTSSSMGTTYEVWALQQFTDDELATPDLSAPGSDYNSNGISNLMAYAFNFDPKTPTNLAYLPDLVRGNDGSFGVSFRRRHPGNDLTYNPETSVDLRDWKHPNLQMEPPVANPDGTMSLVYRDPEGMSLFSRGFVRVRINLK